MSTLDQSKNKTFRIVFTKNGKKLAATVEASSQEEAMAKLQERIGERLSGAKVLRLFVQGTHCASCEVLIERRFKKIPGVKDATINYRTGEARVTLEGGKPPSLHTLESAIQDKGYRVFSWMPRKGVRLPAANLWTGRDFKEIGAVLLIVFGGYLFLRHFDLFPKSPAFSENLTYPFIFLVGLVAAGSSCLAVVGGLLISVSASWSQLTQGQSRWTRLQPHLLFNGGRLASYAFFGGVIGAAGKAFSISPEVSGFLMAAAALFMIFTGLAMLNIVKKNPLLLTLPKRFQHAIHDAESKRGRAAAFFLGAATFFLPCGFTQAFQIYAVTTGSFQNGALTMLVFALGTLPALIGIGALSALLKGTPFRLFLKFAGAVVLFLGLFNINNGLTLMGVPPDILAAKVLSLRDSQTVSASFDDPFVTYDGTRQIVSTKVFSYGYEPNIFTIRRGVPVEWHITGVATGGCASIVTVPKYNITRFIKQGSNIVKFTPYEAGEVSFHCSMAMFRGKFIVVDDLNVKVTNPDAADDQNTNIAAETCATGNCQQVRMEISREKGFYPRNFTVKKGVPVEWIIDDKIPLGGCMGTMVIPDYSVAEILKIGENRIVFTPDREGTVPFTCSMGARIGSFTVI